MSFQARCPTGGDLPTVFLFIVFSSKIYVRDVGLFGALAVLKVILP